MSQPHETTRVRVGTAHLTASVLAGAGLLFVLLTWSAWPDADDVSVLDGAARTAYWSGLLYLMVTATLSLRIGRALRRGDGVFMPIWAVLMAAHLAVLMVTVVAAGRGTSSRLYHAGLEHLAATLGALSTLMILLAIISWRKCGRRPAAEDQAGGSASDCFASVGRARLILLVTTCLLVVATFVYLEIQPLPHR